MTGPRYVRLITPDEAAWFLGVSVRTVQRLCASGRLAHRKVGGRLRFTDSDLRAYEEAVAVAAKATEEASVAAVEQPAEQPAARRPRRRYPRVIEETET